MTIARATVFGLDVRAELPLALLAGASTYATARRLELAGCPAADLGSDTPRRLKLISEQRQPDGELSFSIEAHPEVGYLIRGPRYGAHLLSADGLRLKCASAGVPAQSWQRMLIAQVLPFAAVLQGLEVLHASAVTIDGQAVAFVGPSGSGKTSLALELCGLGAGFLADDVLALERQPTRLLGHAGSPVAGVARVEAERVGDRLGEAEILGSDARELLVAMAPAPTPAPLGAVFFLDRDAHGPARPRFEPVADARTLLSATFNLLLRTPERLRELLDVCTLIARGRVERVLIGPAVDVQQLGRAIGRRLEAA